MRLPPHLLNLRRSLIAGPDPPAAAAIEIFNLLLERAKATRKDNEVVAYLAPADGRATKAELIVYVDQLLASNR